MSPLFSKLTQQQKETAVQRLNQFISGIDKETATVVAQTLRWSALAISLYAISGGDLSMLQATAPFLANLASAIGGDLVASFLEKLADGGDKTPAQIEQLLQSSLAQSQRLDVLLSQLPTQAELYKAINYLEKQNQQRHDALLDTLLPWLRPLLSPTEPVSPAEPPPLDHLPDPAPLPPSSHMPYGRIQLFTGRQPQLLAIAQALWAEAAEADVVITATGMGGVGKTSLAIEFAHRYGRYFPGGVFWLSFADPQGIANEVAACAAALGLPTGLPQPEQVALVQRAWRQPDPRLLIFDNCDGAGAERLLAEWRPPSGGGRILVTSRRGHWDPALGVRPLALDELPRAESRLLLQRLAGGDPADPVWDAIADELGDLPLALHLGGRFLATYGHDISPAAYLAELRAGDLLAHPSLTGHGGVVAATDREMHVARAFALSYDRLKPDAPGDALALALLARAACLAPGEAIPRDLLWATMPAENGPAENALPSLLPLADGLRRLEGLGLLTSDDGGRPRLHRLLAAFVARATAELPRAEVERAVLQRANEQNNAGYPLALQSWQVHLRHVVNLAQSREDERAADLGNTLGFHLKAIGDYAGARPYYERALAIWEKALGPEQHNEALLQATALSLNNLGALLYSMGHLAAARPYYERALAIREKALGPEHPDTARSLNNLGSLLQAMGHLAAARPYYERALAILEKALGPEHHNEALLQATASSLNNLGALLDSLGNLAAARPYYERALAIFEKALGPAHPDTASSLNNLGALLDSMGELAAARPYYERALAIREKALGPEHPDTASSLNNLGALLDSMGDLAAARPYYERALAICEKALGPEHPDTASSLNNLAILAYYEGDMMEATRLMRRALAIWEQRLGPEHPDTQTARESLAVIEGKLSS